MEDEILDPEREDSESSSDTEAKSGISADLIRGHINTIILRTLYERDKYGYEIIEEIETKSHGQYSLKQPTLYSALKRLENQGYINAYWKTDEVSQGGRRKYYTLTDSGREVTERNQAEWEYSRTVIDNLISDRNFDFTQPPPAPVDFKILKNSTSRIRSVKDDEVDEGRVVNYEEPPKEQIVEIQREDATSVVITKSSSVPSVDAAYETPTEQPRQVEQPEPQSVQETQPVEQQFVERPAEEPPVMTDEERQILHENYLRLIANPERKTNVNETPYADSIDTSKIIYNNRPETERDYRNLINNLFINTVRDNPAPAAPISEPEPQPQYQPQPEPVMVEQPQPQYEAPRQIVVENIHIDEISAKARNDGLTVGTTEYTFGTGRKKYIRGSAMFKCAIIIGVIMLLEFALCIIFKNELGITLAYPFVIFALAGAEVLIFGVLCFTDVGKSSRRPTAKTYIPACVIVATILIVVIFLTSLLLNINFTSVGDIMAKIVIPCIIALNIPIYGLLLYLFSK